MQKDLETVNYHLALGSGQGRGTYIIIRNRDGATTLRNTGSEAQADYARFKRAYDISGQSFDELCARETFSS